MDDIYRGIPLLGNPYFFCLMMSDYDAKHVAVYIFCIILPYLVL